MQSRYINAGAADRLDRQPFRPHIRVMRVFHVRKRMSSLTVATCVAVSVMVSSVQLVQAEASDPLMLEYEAYFGGFHVASGRTSIALKEEGYTITGKARARGLLDWYSGWQGKAVSKGRIGADGAVQPVIHDNGGVWRGSTRRNALVFKPDGSVDVEQESPPDPNKLTPIPPASIPGTVDPISAILFLAGVIEKGGDCNGSIPIYDGRRRYDLSVTAGETRVFEKNDYTIFSGEAMACEVEFRKIGGFRKEQSKYSRTARDRTVWVARPLPDAPPIPVRVDVETDFGQLVVHLTAARHGGNEIALEPGTDNLAD